jgi:hypothetical protein
MGPQVKQVLVVASKTANSDRLMKEIQALAATEGCRFTLLIPDARDREKADRTFAGGAAADEASRRHASEGPG